MVLGRSEASLASYLAKLKGKENVRVVCMDLSAAYRALVVRHFPNALIVTDRFHVIRLISQQFVAVWRRIDPVGSKNRGLLSLLRRLASNLRPEQAVKLALYLASHPALAVLYEFRERLNQLLLLRTQTAKACRRLAPILLDFMDQAAYFRLLGIAVVRTHPRFLEARSRTHVALHPEQRHHRRIPQQNGDHQTASLRIPQLRKLPTKSDGNVLKITRELQCPRFWRRAFRNGSANGNRTRI